MADPQRARHRSVRFGKPSSQDVPKRTLPCRARFGFVITGRPRTNVAMMGPFWIRHRRTSQKERCDGGPVFDPPSQDIPKRTLSWRGLRGHTCWPLGVGGHTCSLGVGGHTCWSLAKQPAPPADPDHQPTARTAALGGQLAHAGIVAWREEDFLRRPVLPWRGTPAAFPPLRLSRAAWRGTSRWARPSGRLPSGH